LTLARAINAAQGRLAEETRQFGMLSELGKLPRTPDGFVLHLYTDRESYLFSIKDTRDSCHYAVFSDQQGVLYEQSPSVPHIASVR
jgi:hypothetical protein